MATISNDVIREQRIKVEYIIGLYNQSVSPFQRVNAHDYMFADIETTIPTFVPNAEPRYFATIQKSIGANGPDFVEFELTEKQFLLMERMLMIASNNNKIPTIGDDPRFRIKCDPKITELPALLMSNGLRDVLPNHPGLKAKTTMLAFECPCPKGFFCPSIKDFFVKGQDILHWGSKVQKPKLNQPVIFFIAVPVVDYILYSVPVEASIKTDWDDNQVKKYMTYGINEDVTTFFDDPLDIGGHLEFFMLRDQITNVSMYIQSVMEEKLGTNAEKMTEKLINAVCTNKHHTYGTNRKVMEFMNSRPDAARVAVACFELYSMCPCCYINANPAFSLLDDNLF